MKCRNYLFVRLMQKMEVHKKFLVSLFLVLIIAPFISKSELGFRYWELEKLHSARISYLDSLEMGHNFIRSGDIVRLLQLIQVAPPPSQISEMDCVYTIYVRTGNVGYGGTDSNIGIRLLNKYGDGFLIENLVTWGGLMGDDHDYFEKGNLDIFSGRGVCLNAPVCAILITSDNTGDLPGWYVEYVEITTAGLHVPAESIQFKLNQWLAVDEPPFELTAYRDYCPSTTYSQYPSVLLS